MHIGFLTTEFPTTDAQFTGGIGTSIRNLASLLVEKGISVTIFLWSAKEPMDKCCDGIKIHWVPRKRRKCGLLGVIISQRELSRYINKEINQSKIDLLEVYDWEGNTAFCNIKVPTIMRLHGSNLYFDSLLGRKTSFAISLLERWAAAKADAYIAVSQQSLNLSKRVLGLEKYSEVIYNVINLDLIKQYRKENRMRHRIVFYGTVVDKKGIEYLPLIFNRIVDDFPDATLTVVGKDTFIGGQSAIQIVRNALVLSAQSNFEYLGHVKYETLLEIVSESNVCLLPSKAETFGLVLLEGMLLEKAVVCSDIDCFKEIATDGIDSFQCGVGDVDSMYRRIKMLFEDATLYHDISSNAVKNAEKKFSPQIIVNKNINFYNRLINHE